MTQNVEITYTIQAKRSTNSRLQPALEALLHRLANTHKMTIGSESGQVAAFAYTENIEEICGNETFVFPIDRVEFLVVQSFKPIEGA